MSDEKSKAIEGKIPSFQRTMSIVVGNSRSSRTLVAQEPSVEPKQSGTDYYDYAIYLQSIKQKVSDTQKALQAFSENERKTMDKWNAWTSAQYNPSGNFLLTISLTSYRNIQIGRITLRRSSFTTYFFVTI
jgi:hypothetical protein